MKRISWQEYSALDVSERIPHLSKPGADGEPFHVIYAQQFDRRMLDDLCTLADAIRGINKSPDGATFLLSLLQNRNALNLFAQPSTRTFMSFFVAGCGMPRAGAATAHRLSPLIYVRGPNRAPR